MCKAVQAMSHLRRFATAVCVCLVSLAGGEAQGAANATVRSYRGQFVVTAPDVTYASELAQLCERTREHAQRRLSTRGLWEGAASVRVVRRTVEGADGPQTVWDVSVGRGGVARTARGLWYDDVEGFVEFAVCFHTLRRIAQDSAAAHGGDLQGRPIPFWLTAGLAELMAPEQRFELFQNTGAALDEHRSYLLTDLFAHTGQFESHEQRGIYVQQAATVVDFFLGQKQGPDRLCRSLANLWSKSSFTLSLRWEYRDLFSSTEAMTAAWETYVRERPSRIVGEARLTLAETEALLQLILDVEIPVIAEDTIEQSVVQTDFVGLSKHENRRVVQRICNEKTLQLVQVTLRSAPEFKPALEAYARALNAIRDGRRRRFRHWYKIARREHEAVRKLPYFTTGTEE